MDQTIKLKGSEVLLPIPIRSTAEYDVIKNFWYHPLIYDTFFNIDIRTRITVINTLFGKPCPANDDRFFRWMWKHRPHVCQEYFAPLHEYSAVHISHIITKGSHPEMRYDPRNINILSLKAHNEWEFGTQEQRRKMNIYPQNQRIIKILKSEYQEIS